jgi:hypothetical protein
MTLTQVNSAGIADGAIVNADINNSAAVALSKLATSGTASSSNYLRGDGAWSAIDLSTKLNLTGGTLTGNVIHNDSVKALFGTGSDLSLWHDGSDSIIKNITGELHARSDTLVLASASVYEKYLKGTLNGAVELYYDNSKALETNNQGVLVQGITNEHGVILLNADQGNANADKWFILADKSTSAFQISNFNSGSWETNIKTYGDGAVELYFDGVKQVRTSSTGIVLEDSKRVDLGDNADFRLYHDGSNSYVSQVTAGQNLFLKGDAVQIRSASNEQIIETGANGAVKLYYDNSKKFETTSGGIKTYGGAIEIVAPEGADANIYMSADEGDDHADLWLVQAESDGFWAVKNAASGSWEKSIEANGNGNVELYYDNSKKLETKSYGAAVTGNFVTTGYVNIENGSDLYLADNGKANFGNSTDLEIFHDGSDSWIKDDGTGNLYLSSNGAGINLGKGDSSAFEAMIRTYTDGAVELYYDNNLAFKTDTNGVQVIGTEGNDAYLYLFPDEADDLPDQWRLRAWQADQVLTIESRNGSGTYEKNIACIGDGAVELYHDNSKKFETNSGGTQVFGNLYLADTVGLWLGESSDLKIYHDGSNSYINHGGTGSLYVQSNSSGDDLQLWSMDDIYIRPQGGEEGVKVVGNAHVSLYYDNSQKFYTQSDKCVVAGHFYPESNNSYDLGHPSYRWNNIYVNDMHFSNEGKSNSVDGTWGDWTLQEGDENIFMINNRTGKKYKMGLQEVI